MVLESDGCKVFSATRVLALNQIVAEHPIDLLILCHSLTVEECERARSIVHAFSPQAKILILVAGSFPRCATPEDPVVSTGDGPKALLETVDELVEHGMRPEPSGGAPGAAHAQKASA